MQQSSISWTEALDAPLVEAAKHRERMWLENTNLWSWEQPKSPQAILFQCLAGARPMEAQAALQHGASPTSLFECRWPGVEGGELNFTTEAGAAYLWRGAEQGRTNWIAVYTPGQAAVAGACPQCLRLLAACGGNLEGVMAWLLCLPISVPRLEAGLALCDAVDTTNLIYRVPLRDWLERAQRWLNRQSQQAWQGIEERVLRAQRGLLRVGPGLGLKLQPTPPLTAVLL